MLATILLRPNNRLQRTALSAAAEPERSAAAAIGGASVAESVARLLARWRAAGVTPNPGATAADLSGFESANRVRLPEDLRAFLRVADGIPFSELDGLARLRPLAEYFRIVDRVSPELVGAADLPDPERYWCFGDYNIEGSLWSIRLWGESGDEAPVRVFWHYSGGGQLVASSFEAFLTRYLTKGPDGMC